MISDTLLQGTAMSYRKTGNAPRSVQVVGLKVQQLCHEITIECNPTCSPERTPGCKAKSALDLAVDIPHHHQAGW